MTDTAFHLRGNYAPVQDEVAAHDLTVTGALPPELTGLYVRNGANPVTGTSAHWFLGNGMLHGVRLDGGRASWYRNRYVRTPLLHDPDAERISPEGEIDRTLSLANTHVVRHAGRILALEEGSFPYEVDARLDTVGCHDYDGRLTTAMTAHPKTCPETGELHFFGYGQFDPLLTYHVADAEGRLVRSDEIPVNGPTMIHDFGITRGHALFMDLPVVFDLEAALAGTMPFHWSDDYPARVGVLPRGAPVGELRWFDVDPCYVFHPLNAFDDGDTVVFDVCRISELWRRPGEFTADGQTTLHRWRFDLATGVTKEETLHDDPQDFPRVADGRVGLRHRHGYTVGTNATSVSGDSTPGNDTCLYQHDLDRTSSVVHDFGPGRHPGEGVFVPADPSGGATDDAAGWVLAYVHDETDDATDLVVLDASDVAGREVAAVRLPRRVPYGFHGSWLAD